MLNALHAFGITLSSDRSQGEFNLLWWYLYPRSNLASAMSNNFGCQTYYDWSTKWFPYHWSLRPEPLESQSPLFVDNVTMSTRHCICPKGPRANSITRYGTALCDPHALHNHDRGFWGKPYFRFLQKEHVRIISISLLRSTVEYLF